MTVVDRRVAVGVTSKLHATPSAGTRTGGRQTDRLGENTRPRRKGFAAPVRRNRPVELVSREVSGVCHRDRRYYGSKRALVNDCIHSKHYYAQ